MYLLSISVTWNAVHHEIDIYFQGHNIGNANIWKSVELSTNSQLRFVHKFLFTIEWAIAHDALQDIYLNFLGQISETLISMKR